MAWNIEKDGGEESYTLGWISNDSQGLQQQEKDYIV